MGKDDDIFEGTNQEEGAGAATLDYEALRAYRKCWAEIQQHLDCWADWQDCQLPLTVLEPESGGVLEDFIIKSRSQEKFPEIPEPFRNSVSAGALDIRKSISLVVKSSNLMTRLLGEQASSADIRQGAAGASQMCTKFYRYTEMIGSSTEMLGKLLDVCGDESARRSYGILQTEVSARLQALMQLKGELEELCLSATVEMEKKYPSPVVPPEEHQRRSSVLEELKRCIANNHNSIAKAIDLADQVFEEVKALSLEPETERAILAIVAHPVKNLLINIQSSHNQLSAGIDAMSHAASKAAALEWGFKVHTLTRDAWEEFTDFPRYTKNHLKVVTEMLLYTPEGDRREHSYIDNFVRPILEKNEKLANCLDNVRAEVVECKKLCEAELRFRPHTIVDAVREDSEETRVIPSHELQEAADIIEEDSEKETRVTPPRRPWQERAKAAFASFAVASALLLQGMLLAALCLLFFSLYVIFKFGQMLFSSVKEMAGRLLSSPGEEGVEHVSSPVEERVEERVARDTDEPGSRTNYCKAAGAYSLAIALVVLASPLILLLAIALSIWRTSGVIFHAATAPFKAAASCYSACMEKFQQEEGGSVIGPCIRECILQSTYEQLRQAGCEQKVLALFNKHFSPESSLGDANVSVVTTGAGRRIFVKT